MQYFYLRMMLTLRDVLETINGLYREPESGRGLPRHDLLASLSGDALSRPVRIRKRAPGIFGVVEPDGGLLYELFSRREQPRMES